MRLRYCLEFIETKHPAKKHPDYFPFSFEDKTTISVSMQMFTFLYCSYLTDNGEHQQTVLNKCRSCVLKSE